MKQGEWDNRWCQTPVLHWPGKPVTWHWRSGEYSGSVQGYSALHIFGTDVKSESEFKMLHDVKYVIHPDCRRETGTHRGGWSSPLPVKQFYSLFLTHFYAYLAYSILTSFLLISSVFPHSPLSWHGSGGILGIPVLLLYSVAYSFWWPRL